MDDGGEGSRVTAWPSQLDSGGLHHTPSRAPSGSVLGASPDTSVAARASSSTLSTNGGIIGRGEGGSAGAVSLADTASLACCARFSSSATAMAASLSSGDGDVGRKTDGESDEFVGEPGVLDLGLLCRRVLEEVFFFVASGSGESLPTSCSC